MKKFSQFLVLGPKFLIGLGLFLIVSVFILILQVIFLALSAPCTACVNLSAWLSQTLTLLAPALASLTGGIFLKEKERLKQTRKV